MKALALVIVSFGERRPPLKLTGRTFNPKVPGSRPGRPTNKKWPTHKIPGQGTLTGDDLRVAMPSMGARLGELCALRWSDVDFGEKTVLIARFPRLSDHQVEGPGSDLVEKDPSPSSDRP
jgi:integrase